MHRVSLPGARRLLLALALLLPAGRLGAQIAPAGETLSGWFYVLWTVPQRDESAAVQTFQLVDDQQRWHELEVPSAVLRAAGGARALDRRRVTVTAMRQASLTTAGKGPRVSRYTVTALRADGGAALPGASLMQAAATPAAAQSGSKAYVTILCRFADSVTVMPQTRETYVRWFSAEAPGLNHFWREQSYGQMNIDGSIVVGWYDLPFEKAYYLPSTGTPNLGAMAKDCMGAADADVWFPAFFGVNLQFNGTMPASWGGGGFVDRDGERGSKAMTWMASWATIATYGHEMGHSLGLPHSSGPYGETYDSRWDVMSGGGIMDDRVRTRVGVHTVSHHKQLLGWIPDARRYVPPMPSSAVVTLDPLGGSSATAYLMAQLPKGLGDRAYTVETRRQAGSYDLGVPGTAVLLHDVDLARGDREAQVIDADGNGNTNDDGAMWTPGERWADSVTGYSVEVLGARGDAFDVDIVRGWRLLVSVVGDGRVAGALDCGAGSPVTTCAALYSSRGTPVSLTTAAGAGSTFLGWGGDCAGSGGCNTAMNGNRVIAAVFGQPMQLANGGVPGYVITGRPLAHTMSVSGGLGSYQWLVASGALPPGLALDAATGRIAGTPTTAGVYRPLLRVTSTAWGHTISDTMTVTYAVYRPLAITSDSARPWAIVGAPYADQMQASAGPLPPTWDLASGELPPGIALDAAGRIAGTATALGAFDFTVRATSDTLQASRRHQLRVVAPLALASDSARPAGLMGAGYLDTIRTTGGFGATQWTLTSGALPPGVALERGTGILRGVPTAAGQYAFTLTGSNGPLLVTRQFGITVSVPALAEAAVLAQLLDGTTPLSVNEVRYLDLVGNRNGRLDVGDVRAWLLASGRSSSEAAGVLSGALPPATRAAKPASRTTSTRNTP